MKNSEQDLLKSATLRECPFCGWEEPSLMNAGYGGCDDHCVKCLNCGAEGASVDTVENCIKEWNTRINEQKIEWKMQLLKEDMEKAVAFIKKIASVNLKAKEITEARELLEELQDV